LGHSSQPCAAAEAGRSGWRRKSEAARRRESLPAEIVGATLGQAERDVPAAEAQPLPPNAELAHIGKSVPRSNAADKVTGATRFTADVALPRMLYARLLRAPLPHARLRAIDLSAAERQPGVRATHMILGPAGGGTTSVSAEEDVSATRRIEEPVALYAGMAVAAVAAVSPEAAEEGVRLIKVDWQPLPFVVDMDEARADDAPKVFDELDVQPGSGASGLVRAGLPSQG
jgi:xanthine dehydrogenase YagR molybdenum-binding subunit